MTRDDERSVIDRVLSGDKNAFEEIVLAHQKNVYNLALKMVGEPEDALDLSQEAFLRAYQSLASFRGDCRFSVWLYRMTSNICLDFLRRKKRRDTLPLYTKSEDDGEDIETEIPDERFSPEKTLLQKELREAIQTGLTSLSDNDRQILTLREIGGLSYDEIASALQMDIGTVKSRLFRARKRLCAFLMENGNISEETASKERKGV